MSRRAVQSLHLRLERPLCSPRYASRTLGTCSRRHISPSQQHPQRIVLQRIPSAAHFTSPRQQWQRTQTRWHSASGSNSKLYSFDEIKSLSERPDPQRILIDVREPAEYTAGYIPGAHNMPIKSQPDALFLPDEEFEERFGFAKPDAATQEVVFYCRSGVRSSAAAKLAEQGGYGKVGEYQGSWNEWSEKGGEVGKP